MAISRTPEALEAIEREIIASNGDIIAASRTLQFNPADLHQWMQSDPTTNATIQAARRLGWMALESEAIRRATGYEEEVWYQGEMVGTTTKYSDGLLQTLLKARVDGHQPDQQSHGPTVNVNILPRASSYEEWQAQRSLQLSSGSETVVNVASNGEPSLEQRQMQLAGPTVDAEFTEISDAAKAAYTLMVPPVEDDSNGLPDWL